MRWVVVLLVACGSTAPRLWPAGSKEDDGHGLLARASTRFQHSDDEGDDDLFASSSPNRTPVESDELGGESDGGLGGAGYGGSTYATFTVPNWSTPSVERKPKYAQAARLSGAIEGTVSWRSAAPARLATACGSIDALALGADRSVPDVLVYIERVQVGRTLPYEGKPSNVGGLVVKRGCALVPAVQIVTPLPAALAIHGDSRRSRVQVTPPSGTGRPYELQEGGRVVLQLLPGVTRVGAEDATLGAAWVLALDTPYYAITDDRGRFRIDELGAGVYDVTIWQAPIPSVVNGALAYGAPVVVHRTVAVDAAKVARFDVSLGR
jgi:hypothetical protein